MAAQSYAVARERPPVLLAVVENGLAAQQLAEHLRSERPDDRFIWIVALEAGDDLGPLLAGLAPVLAEMIFTASASPSAQGGETLAWQALDELGVGQDSVYTVPELAAAIRYGLGVLAAERHNGWEGSALLVAGSAATVAEAREALAADRS